ncbi:hypothetical protein [Streptomyces sp. CB03911]|uniref:hypothetical protein n=1 Tax=Streptomyces sp. CB03911 TaxID=1804758 RepID=UPI00093A0B7D|nr:hypothetical protein [Streptomyces sp. CB03911]OKI19283.1 hypothetical protein A6A07_07215 [Streptomyces sp. CB03911]
MGRQLTDFTGADIRVGSVGVYPSRQGNTVRNSEAVVQQIHNIRDAKGRSYPELVVQPTGRDSGHIQRKTRKLVEIAAEHFAVTGYTELSPKA